MSSRHSHPGKQILGQVGAQKTIVFAGYVALYSGQGAIQVSAFTRQYLALHFWADWPLCESLETRNGKFWLK